MNQTNKQWLPCAIKGENDKQASPSPCSNIKGKEAEGDATEVNSIDKVNVCSLRRGECLFFSIKSRKIGVDSDGGRAELLGDCDRRAYFVEFLGTVLYDKKRGQPGKSTSFLVGRLIDCALLRCLVTVNGR